ncbi:FAD-dependent oxidoreductase [Streptomyces sp. NPDC089424]|uniref:FAD-dependent oxidoreductase n=1 Tax=Streptomyces sp. NPDC089424 TaxID=3365917 RepID=UPI0038128495
MALSQAKIFECLSDVATPQDARALFRTAHVLGGSIGGLLAARVLSDHSEHVVIIEPDTTGAGCDPRPGVPQGYQVHILLPGGRTQLERWYPGIVQQALDEGALLSPPQQTALYVDGVQEVTTSNAELVTSSRPFLESVIRRQTLALPNVEMRTGRAVGVECDRDVVNKVRYRTSCGESVEATDFVVDATGRGSRLSDWLAKGGWPIPELERLKAGIRYFTARFARPPGWTGFNIFIHRYSAGFPSDGLCGALATAIENQQWALTLAYFDGERERMSEEDFRARCRELHPFYDEVVSNQQQGALISYRHPESRWRHFESLGRFPARLAPMGDAVASFNPVFGQGMSSAALHASCLSDYLRSDPDLNAPARRFMDLQKVVVEAAWGFSTRADAARLGIVEEPVTEDDRWQAWAMQQVLSAVGRDEQVTKAFRAAAFMTTHPATLLAPELVRRALAVNTKQDA